MAFASIGFFLFLFIIFFLFLLAPVKYRWVVLLAASLAFYAVQSSPTLFLVLAFIILESYGFGIWLNAENSAKKRNWLLTAGITVSILPLLTLRYLPVVLAQFFQGMVFEGGSGLWATIGVSFYTFQAISYLIDIFLGTLAPERHFGFYALYLSFFPKIIQGPIERGQELLPQLHQMAPLRYKNAIWALIQIAWGLILKLVLADRLGSFVNPVYNNVADYHGWPLIIATYLYALQIYFDFAGYTYIAIGVAKFFNINLTNNFNRPYFATSIADFWRRWHISFSRWILDYIFKPLQLQWRNWAMWGSASALIITFLISGLWHGASLGFVIWGLLHGIFMAVYVFTAPFERKLLKKMKGKKLMGYKIAQIFLTFNLVCFAWIFFRANSVTDSIYVVTNLFSGLFSSRSDSVQSFIQTNLLLGQSAKNAMILAGLLLIVALVSAFKKPLVNLISNKFLNIVWSQRRWFSIQMVVMVLMMIVFAVLVTTSGTSPFIYTVF